MKILGKNLQFKYENQAVENEEFIKVILDHAASLNVNDNFHSTKLTELNLLVQYFLDRFPLELAVLLKGVPESYLAKEHDRVTNHVQSTIFDNFVEWFKNDYYSSEKYPNQDYHSVLYGLFYDASYHARELDHNRTIKKMIGILPISTIYKRVVHLKSNFREIVFETAEIDHKTEKLEIRVVPILSSVTTKWYLAAIIHALIDFYKGLKPLKKHTTRFFYNAATGVMRYTFYYPKKKRYVLPIELLDKWMFYSPKAKQRTKVIEEYQFRMKQMDNIASNWINTHRKNLLNRDEITGLHVGNVTFYTMLCLMALGVNTKMLRIGIMGGLIHDIGKEAIPDEVLHYEKKFTLLHRAIMDDHNLLGAALALDETLGMDRENRSDSKTEFRKNLIDHLAGYNVSNYVDNIIEIIILTIEHHEDVKGKGIPYGASPQEISLVGLVMQVADVFEALTAKRQYKSAMSIEKAMDLMLNKMPTGTFDPKVVELFFETVLPFLTNTFGKDNFTDHVRCFLTEIHDEHKPLKNALLSVLSGNVYVRDINLLKGLDAKQHSKNWALSRNHNIKTIDDFKNNLIRSLRGHFHKLDCISVMSYYFSLAEKEFEDEKDEKVKFERTLETLKTKYNIPKNMMCILEESSWGRRLPKFWENYLYKNDWAWFNEQFSALNAEKETLPEYMAVFDLVSLTKKRYEFYVPFLMTHLEERLDADCYT